ncbi:hypothetical protein GOP47_0007428 [Adiantum capillus-veneris]|uniref:histidine kinase n=1 Tax=Adiantum capillus-veneris TaxID=13818 RepID=A0A9D4ZJA5_ADICA|nr:hypothetical protein GOP47_0007428 [Adiantum capillus-veneris]
MCKEPSRHPFHGGMKYIANSASLEQNTPLLDASRFANSHLTARGKPGAKWWERPDFESQGSLPSTKTKWGNFNMMSLVWLLATAGLVVAGVVYQFFSRQHYKHYEDVLGNMCDERARMLQHQFAVSINHVHALAVLVSTFYLRAYPSVLDQDTFAEYTARTSFERPLMTGVAYAHRVRHAERDAFERMQGWTIKTMHSRESSPAYDEYAPTIFSQETIGYLVSLDMMSGEEDRDNIFRARASGKGALTKPFRVLESNHLGVVLTYAVYKEVIPPEASVEQRIEAAAGYLGGAFDVESLVENLLSRLARSEDIVVNVYDITNSSEPMVMYGPEAFSECSLLHTSTLDFGDPYRKHHMQCRLSRQVPYPTLAIGFAGGVLSFVALICAMVYNAHMHVKKVEEGYRKMEELKVQAEAADIAKSQFLATVSHEIRTPMNGVLGMLQMLLDTQLNPAQQDFARTAQASGKALITLINEVLDQAKIESGRIELEMVPFDVRAILDDVLSLFSGKTRGEGIELAAFVSERVPSTLIGDPGRLRQIMANLVGNSVKFTERGHIFVCVHLCEDIESVQMSGNDALVKDAFERSKASSIVSSSTLSGYSAANKRSSWDLFKLLLANEGAKACVSPDSQPSEVKLFISVEDTGIGIPSQARPRIFKPFMQADSSTSRMHGGTGIGLSISNCLVNLMGGQMGFDSIQNVGSTFTFTVLLRRGGLANPSVGSNTKLCFGETLPTKFKGMKALVVDGRPLRSEVTKQHLQRLGICVKTADDWNAAVDELSNTRNFVRVGGASSSIGEFHMILVDKDAWGLSTGLNFPAAVQESMKKGKRTLSRLETHHPKMILMATHMAASDLEKAKLMGFVDTIIMKPLRARMIAACLEQILVPCDNDEQGCPLEEPRNLRRLLSGRLILVVDDNRINRLVAAGALKKYGADVECADSGKAAIAKLHPPHRFDACFMDIQMPEMDGFEATMKIREVEESVNDKEFVDEKAIDSGEGRKRWRVPILAMTADVIQATYDECVRKTVVVEAAVNLELLHINMKLLEYSLQSLKDHIFELDFGHVK